MDTEDEITEDQRDAAIDMAWYARAALASLRVAVVRGIRADLSVETMAAQVKVIHEEEMDRIRGLAGHLLAEADKIGLGHPRLKSVPADPSPKKGG